MSQTTTEWVMITRAEAEILQAQLTPGGCICCDTVDDVHDNDCSYAAGLDAMMIHVDAINTFAIERMGNSSRCLLCGESAYGAELMSDHHADDCSLSEVRL